MHKIIALSLILSLFSCGSSNKKNISQAESQTKSQTKGWSNEGLAKAKNYWNTMHESGVVIIANGKEIANWGPTDKKIKLSSVRKSLLSVLYGPFVEEGIINLDRTLKELKISDHPDSLFESEQAATVRMLLQSRSGVYHSYVGGTPSMKKSQPQRRSHNPGSFWYYNNWDFNVLGSIFEQETQISIGKAFDEKIGSKIGFQDFDPSDVYYLQDEQSMHRQYHFRMTTRDLAKVGQLMIQNGQWNGEKIISSDWIEESTRSYSDTHLKTGYGYMWWKVKEGILFNGPLLPDGSYAAFGAVGKFLAVIPKYDLVIANVQMKEWPDYASSFPQSELPNYKTEQNNRNITGNLVKLILEARIEK